MWMFDSMAMQQVSPSLVPQHPPPSQPPMMDGGRLNGFIVPKPRSCFYTQLSSSRKAEKQYIIVYIYRHIELYTSVFNRIYIYIQLYIYVCIYIYCTIYIELYYTVLIQRVFSKTPQFLCLSQWSWARRVWSGVVQLHLADQLPAPIPQAPQGPVPMQAVQCWLCAILLGKLHAT